MMEASIIPRASAANIGAWALCTCVNLSVCIAAAARSIKHGRRDLFHEEHPISPEALISYRFYLLNTLQVRWEMKRLQSIECEIRPMQLNIWKVERLQCWWGRESVSVWPYSTRVWTSAAFNEPRLWLTRSRHFKHEPLAAAVCLPEAGAPKHFLLEGQTLNLTVGHRPKANNLYYIAGVLKL